LPIRDEQVEGGGRYRESEGQCEKAHHACGLSPEPVDPVAKKVSRFRIRWAARTT
jgi:hypothetical protein